eukprot:GCRY01001919.1.p1 GENE.GCRY01001919.1~~GCRY01001919.1.p1  ORF type:complete len:457 (-),score=100.01 GCRY01001919.1:855-2225(-)
MSKVKKIKKIFFQDEKPLLFFLSPSEKMKEKIDKFGGKVVDSISSSTIVVRDVDLLPKQLVFSEDNAQKDYLCVNVNFVEDSIKQGKILNVNDYLFPFEEVDSLQDAEQLFSKVFPDCFAFKDFSESEMQNYVEIRNKGEKLRFLAAKFSLRDHRVNPRSDIILEFYFGNLEFAQECSFTLEQSSAFFTLMKQTFEHAFGHSFPSNTFKPIELAYDYFLHHLLRHCIAAFLDPKVDLDSMLLHQSPAGLFSDAETKMVVDFVVTTFFSHYNLIASVFTQERTVRSQTIKVFVESAACPLPLASAYAEESWAKKLAEDEEARRNELAALEARRVEDERRAQELAAAAQKAREQEELNSLIARLGATHLRELAAQAVALQLSDLRLHMEKVLKSQEEDFAGRVGRLEAIAGVGVGGSGNKGLDGGSGSVQSNASINSTARGAGGGRSAKKKSSSTVAK